MIRQEEISRHWNVENYAFFREASPTVLGIKEAVFEIRRNTQKAFRRGFEAAVKPARSRSWVCRERSEMIDFVGIPDKTDSDCWTLDFGIPSGARRVSVVFDHGEKKVYVDGELYLTLTRSREEAENA